LDIRTAPRLALLFLGALLARGRRTVTSWIRAAQLSTQFRACYTTLAAAGKRADAIATRLICDALKPLATGLDRLVLALDDTPTTRYGPHVQGAGIHHNPHCGQDQSPLLYGHVWVVLALLVSHPLWGVIALPLLTRLYIRKKDLETIDKKHRPTFKTKLVLAVELVRWAKLWLDLLGKPLWVVVDGAYAKSAFLKPLIAAGITLVSRLRKDAALRDVPVACPGQRGRPRKYGKNAISLSKRAGQKRGWLEETLELYGKKTTKRVKTFLATWRPTGGVIRVVLVDEPKGWLAFFCTKTDATVAEILGLVADRFSLENCFRDVKEVVGAGQQQTRHMWASVGSFAVCLWTFTLTECWAWNRSEEALVNHRSESPWDDKPRRPSHADKRRAWRRELLAGEIEAVLHHAPNTTEIHDLTERMLNLAA
jgi:hypothetical protein